MITETGHEFYMIIEMITEIGYEITKTYYMSCFSDHLNYHISMIIEMITDS